MRDLRQARRNELTVGDFAEEQLGPTQCLSVNIKGGEMLALRTSSRLHHVDDTVSRTLDLRTYHSTAVGAVLSSTFQLASEVHLRGPP